MEDDLKQNNQVYKDLLIRNSYVKPSTQCWIWLKAKADSDGYGSVRINKVNYRVHRLAYMLWNDVYDLDKLHVCHKCDVPPCINPEHLFLGNHSDNMKDREKKGRGVSKSIRNGRFY
jgi:hypothetical protein